MRLRAIVENFDFKVPKSGDFIELLWQHPLATELPFPVFSSFRNFMLANPNQVQIDRLEPITPHEIKVGGAKKDGKHNTVTATVPRAAISAGDYAKHVTHEELWQVINFAVQMGYNKPDPAANCGDSYSIFENIVNLTNNSVTFTMQCWLPDFEYLEQLRQGGRDKY